MCFMEKLFVSKSLFFHVLYYAICGKWGRRELGPRTSATDLKGPNNSTAGVRSLRSSLPTWPSPLSPPGYIQGTEGPRADPGTPPALPHVQALQPPRPPSSLSWNHPHPFSWANLTLIHQFLRTRFSTWKANIRNRRWGHRYRSSGR